MRKKEHLPITRSFSLFYPAPLNPSLPLSFLVFFPLILLHSSPSSSFPSSSSYPPHTSSPSLLFPILISKSAHQELLSRYDEIFLN